MTDAMEATPPPEGAGAVEVAPGVLWLRQPMPSFVEHVNIFALEEGEGWCVIDTGFDSPEARALWEAWLTGPLKGRPLRRMIATHHHPDHIGLAGWLCARFGIPLEMPRSGYFLARWLLAEAHEVPPQAMLDFWHRAGMDAQVLAVKARQRPSAFSGAVHPLPEGYLRLREGQQIRFGGRLWQIRMGEGHAPEHATFWSCDDDLVIGGDQLLRRSSPNLGVQFYEPEAPTVRDWIASAEALAAHAREDHLVLPGHGPVYRGLPARLAHMARRHRDALDRLEAHLNRPRQGGDCFSPLFRRSIGPEIYGLALAETLGHLNTLTAQDRALRETGADGIWRWRKT
ncbi:MBL fold metallo-hydrolase [Pseudoroseicyclus aestuarii]|uniref:Glyoxylase-like metal-dependent hydrolase (Beta-lactamase superfamily II) n=1 Tax=Pseudoroseicyclus aestuarii TaxID=1795041 RepID=A0A318T680_9RHOB|nr:MBL fold metallo-hydrolase [Pseudoroseicyclus aestuarii]PYE83888.1 glyoxylase-like metal-dependent hydrolase (beta-lactamase superfamily II) [Pseudoroseicyclus aestuarii]